MVAHCGRYGAAMSRRSSLSTAGAYRCLALRQMSVSDLLVIAAPHPDYRDLQTDKPVADIWNILGEGMRI